MADIEDLTVQFGTEKLGWTELWTKVWKEKEPYVYMAADGKVSQFSLRDKRQRTRLLNELRKRHEVEGPDLLRFPLQHGDDTESLDWDDEERIGSLPQLLFLYSRDVQKHLAKAAKPARKRADKHTQLDCSATPSLSVEITTIGVRPVGASSQAVFVRKATKSANMTMDGLIGSLEWHREEQQQVEEGVESMRDRAILLQSTTHAGIVASMLPSDAKDRTSTIERLEEAGPGAWGENLSVGEGLDHLSVCVGDEWEVERPPAQRTLMDRASDFFFAAPAPARLLVTSPRLPCTRNDTRFGPGVRAVAATEGLAGAFLRVVVPGEVRCGDRLALRVRRYPQWTLQRVAQLVYGGDHGRHYPYKPEQRRPSAAEQAALQELAQCGELAECEWKSVVREILERS